MSQADRERVAQTIARIKDLHARVAPLVAAFDGRLANLQSKDGAEYASAEFWHTQAIRQESCLVEC